MDERLNSTLKIYDSNLILESLHGVDTDRSNSAYR